MSFLNPISEPVKRFKSTDAGAPQINYNAPTAGNIKTVLKACLVDGYGTVPSAGWTAVNEVDNVCEFVSPSADMSNYRFGIDDSVWNKIIWYYKHQDIRINPANNSPDRVLRFIDKTHVSNGWQLFVTDLGLLLVELAQLTDIGRLTARITYWGKAKSGLMNDDGNNIVFFNIGQDGAITYPRDFYSTPASIHIRLGSHTATQVSAATSIALTKVDFKTGISAVDLVSDIYLATSTQDAIIGALPPVLSKVINNTSDVYGISDSVLDGRNVLSVCAGWAASDPSTAIPYSRTFLIPTDYWEY